ncbi:MAG: secretin N-terminal domain-containing protein [Thermodesulfovibrionales bacterium]
MHDRLKPLTLAATIGVLAAFTPHTMLMAQTEEPEDTEQAEEETQQATPQQALPQAQPPLGPVRPEVLQEMQMQRLQLLQQQGQIQIPQQPQQAPRQVTPAAPVPQPQQFPRRGTISFNFDDADVYSVIQTIFGDILKVNYIVDPRVRGRVTFRTVSPVVKEDVLPLMEVVLRLNGVGVVEDNGLYRVVPIGDIAREPAAVAIGREADKVRITGKALLQIVPMKYVKSSDMVKMLTPFASTNAVIVDVPNSNNIIIVDTDSNVKRLLQIIGIFDSERMKQTRPQVHVYAVQNSKAKDVASLLQQIFLGASSGGSSSASKSQSAVTPGQPLAQPATGQAQITTASIGGATNLVSEITRIFPDEVTNSVIVLASPEDYELIGETIKQIDIQPRQVMIEAVVAQVKLEDKLNLGIAWTLQTDFNIKGFNKDGINITGPLVLNPTGYTKNDDGSLSPNAPLSDTSFTFTAYDKTGQNAKLLIQTLAARGKANVLSAPHILVSDNKEAKIQVGDQIPIATSVTTPTTGTTQNDSTILQTSSIQYKDTGTILKVKPQVNDSGLVALELTQEVSSPSLTTVLGSSQYTISKSEVTSNLVVQDGETIVIGGLINEKIDKARRGIPLLMDIPFIGHLFGTTVNETTKTELVILLTPHVIKNQQEAAAVSSGYLQRMKGLREQFGKDEVFGSTFNQGQEKK